MKNFRLIDGRGGIDKEGAAGKGEGAMSRGRGGGGRRRGSGVAGEGRGRVSPVEKEIRRQKRADKRKKEEKWLLVRKKR